jgi:EmrB/QacA subfamily drug resistance transporter
MSVEIVSGANAPGQGYSKKRVALIVGVLSLAAFMSSLDLFIVNLAFPYISHDFHGSSLDSLSWVLNGYSILFAAVLVPAGRWADRIGRRRMFVAGLIVFTLGSILSGVSPNVSLLIASRLVQAVGAGMMVPASLSLLLAAVPGHARAQAIGTWSAIGALGAALGPVIGGFLVELSWRWVFWINIPVGVVTVILAFRVLPESRDETVNARPDMLGAGLVAVAAGSLALALVKAPSWGWTSKDFFGLLVLTVACSLGVVLRSARHDAPVVDLKLLESR